MAEISTTQLRGIVPPIVTPVDHLENVRPEGLKQVIDYVLAGGVHGVFVNGSNGEFYAFDRRNQQIAVETAVEHVNGRVPVYGGASAVATKEAVALAKMVEQAGADVLTVLTPMYVQPSEDELFEHFARIADATHLPVVLYNNPGRTTNTISASLLTRLSAVPNIVSVKNTSLDFSLTLKYIEAVADREDFSVFGGVDYYVYSTLVHGGVGSVAGTANVAPSLVVEIYESFISGDHKASLNAQRRLYPLRDAYGYGTFPVMMKACLNLLGVDVGEPVRPVRGVSEEVKKRTRMMLKEIGLL